ncbi:MAG TPA: carboxypeptidase regulatory-like domain-containing protein, partial [Planctomycetaceae bacterium]|nr:carboxypeptidase regulatory-like domain-containing protein [Planctomycetaceae bacterium]
MTRRSGIILGALFLVALLPAAIFAQGTGTTSSLSGTVTTEGKPLAGVTVTITSPALQGTRTAVTGGGGGYNFPSLPPGAYTVSMQLEGMQPVTKKVMLQLAYDRQADADMRVSSVTEAITVTASAPAVLETTEVVRNFSQKQIQDLPVRRNIRDTVLLAPGVNSNGPNNQIMLSGGPSYDNLFLVNGVVVNENIRGQPHNLFIEDAIQETTI